jgi:hypothetical protein
MKTKRDDARIPILPTYDDQLRVIIVREAGVGKSHVLRSLMWFAYHHGWADSTVVTSYQRTSGFEFTKSCCSCYDELHVASNKCPR